MGISRRKFTAGAGLTAVGGFLGGFISCGNSESRHSAAEAEASMSTAIPSTSSGSDDFQLEAGYIHLAGMLLASNPKPIREAIEKHRKALDENPVVYVNDQFGHMNHEIRKKAGAYMGVEPEEIAITDSTTMGTGLSIAGLEIRQDQEMLISKYEYHATHDAVRFLSDSTGAQPRDLTLFQDIHQVTQEEIVDSVIKRIEPQTRLLTTTWVHSSTGLKMPIKQISEQLAEINAGRDPEDRVILFVDGVHGFGVESASVGDLGCDLFTAGTHKWMFGPRGTGVLYGNRRIHDQVSPVIPSFTSGLGWGGSMSPGGFKPFEHQWAMVEAFNYHQKLGREKVQEQIYSLAHQLKEGLSRMDHVKLYTPMQENLASGIVCFDVDGMKPVAVVQALKERDIIASETPYSPSYARFSPGIFNTEDEMEEVLGAVKELG